MMYRRVIPIFLLVILSASLASAGINPFAKKKSKKDNNPIAGIDSKQPDKVLFDRAMDALKKNRFDVARVTLQTLINTYPDSEYVARAKLAIGDAWYKEGGSTGLAQAEIEYKDFITFFPNMPEAAEAQLKVANIHYKQMEKPDRDYAHAKRAEDEYKQLIQQFPDSQLVPQAKQRLREVQEVLAEREYRIGRFYYLRESYIAGIARLKTLTDTYPLYSKAETALYMLGDSYEHEIDLTRASKRLPENAKGKVLQEFSENAAAAYDKIITHYPTSPEADLAKKRLVAMHLPVPTPTPQAVAQYKAEEAGRKQLGMKARMMLTMHKKPDISAAAKTGEPTMEEPPQTSAPDLMKKTDATIVAALTGKPVPKDGDKTAAKPEASSSSSSSGSDDNNVSVSTTGSTATPDKTDTPSSSSPATAASPNKTEATPSSDPQAALPAPAQVNDAAQPDSAQSSSSDKNQPAASPDGKKTGDDSSTDNKNESSSKKKKKGFFHKIIPF
jgi:outer membrane protein assembly factor BamD